VLLQTDISPEPPVEESLGDTTPDVQMSIEEKQMALQALQFKRYRL